MHIRITRRIHMRMMRMMLFAQHRVVIESKKNCTKPTNRIIYIGIFHTYYPVNRIMGCDE